VSTQASGTAELRPLVPRAHAWASLGWNYCNDGETEPDDDDEEDDNETSAFSAPPSPAAAAAGPSPAGERFEPAAIVATEHVDAAAGPFTAAMRMIRSEDTGGGGALVLTVRRSGWSLYRQTAERRVRLLDEPLRAEAEAEAEAVAPLLCTGWAGGAFLDDDNSDGDFGVGGETRTAAEPEEKSKSRLGVNSPPLRVVLWSSSGAAALYEIELAEQEEPAGGSSTTAKLVAYCHAPLCSEEEREEDEQAGGTEQADTPGMQCRWSLCAHTRTLYRTESRGTPPGAHRVGAVRVCAWSLSSTGNTTTTAACAAASLHDGALRCGLFRLTQRADTPHFLEQQKSLLSSVVHTGGAGILVSSVVHTGGAGILVSSVVHTGGAGIHR
jgi:hypothetical protein